MHAVIEIIMPQVENVEEAVASIMSPFDENDSDNYGSAFW